jgi:hypothetical protein
MEGPMPGRVTGEPVAAAPSTAIGPSGIGSFASGAEPATVLPLTIEESARLVSGWAWAEARLYEVIGGWVPVVLGPAAKIYFDACSQHHAWRARLWEDRRPGLPAHLAGSYDGAGPVIEELAALEDDAGRLGAYCRVVLPRLVLGYRSWQERCSVVPDRPVARALGFALVDVIADWERGCTVLAAYLSGESGEEAAVSGANASRQLDLVLARHGLVPDC